MVQIKRSMSTVKASTFLAGSCGRERGRSPELRAGPGCGGADRTGSLEGRESSGFAQVEPGSARGRTPVRARPAMSGGVKHRRKPCATAGLSPPCLGGSPTLLGTLLLCEKEDSQGLVCSELWVSSEH